MNTSGGSKPVYVPVEYSNVLPGQRKNRLDDRQQAMMIKEAAIKPGVSCLRCFALLVPCQQHLAGAPRRCRRSTMDLRHHACNTSSQQAMPLACMPCSSRHRHPWPAQHQPSSVPLVGSTGWLTLGAPC